MWKTIRGFWAFGFLALSAAFYGVVSVSQNFGLPDLIADCMCNKKGFLPAFCEFFNGFLVKDEGDFLSIMGMIGIVLLTVMIPVAVAMFSDKEEEGEYEILDRDVMLDYVIEAPRLLRYLGFIYIPVFFWAGFSSPVILQVVYLFLWGWGVLGMLGILRKSYQWIKGDKFNFRFEYLQKLNDLNNSKDMKKSWRFF